MSILVIIFRMTATMTTLGFLVGVGKTLRALDAANSSPFSVARQLGPWPHTRSSRSASRRSVC